MRFLNWKLFAKLALVGVLLWLVVSAVEAVAEALPSTLRGGIPFLVPLAILVPYWLWRGRADATPRGITMIRMLSAGTILMAVFALWIDILEPALPYAATYGLGALLSELMARVPFILAAIVSGCVAAVSLAWSFSDPEKIRLRLRALLQGNNTQSSSSSSATPEEDNAELANSTEQGTASMLPTDQAREKFVKEPKAREVEAGHPGFIIGALDKDTLLRYNHPGHILTVAKTRGGKGVSAVIPNLLTYPNGCLVIDPKGENYAITSRTRRTKLGRRVLPMDPFCKQVSEAETAHCNLLDFLDPKDSRFVSDARQLAGLLWKEPEGGAGANAFFNNAARQLLELAIIWVVCAPENLLPDGAQGKRDLYAALLLISHPGLKGAQVSDREIQEARGAGRPVPEKSWLQIISEHPEVGYGVPARTASRFLPLADQTWGSIPQQAGEALAMLDSMPTRRAVCGTGPDATRFRVDEVSSGKADLFLILPPEMLQSEPQLARAMIGAVLLMMMKRNKVHPPVLFMLDEMPALGKMEPIIQAAGVAAGMGVVLWMIVQSISQLMEAYGERNAKTLINNAGVKQFLGFDDQDDAEKVSVMVGDATFVGTSRSETSGASRQALDVLGGVNTSTNVSVQKVKRRLLTADQLMAMDDNTMILKLSNTRPLRCLKPKYFSFPQFAGLYDAWKDRPRVVEVRDDVSI